MSTTLPTAPDLLIEAADTIGNRSAERDNADGERSMNRAVQMFNAWRGQRGHSPMSEADGWAFMVFLKLARAAEGKHRRDDWVDGSAYMALACECIERELALLTAAMPRTRHPWPPADDALMRTEYGRTPTRELAARIGVTPGAVNQRAKKLGLDAGRSVWTPDRIAQLRGLYATHSAQECADLMGLSYKQVVHGVKRAGMRKSREWKVARMREAHQRGTAGGTQTRFAAGHATWNAGMHGLDIGGKQTRFQPGQRSGRAMQLWRPIGSESIDAYGYPIRKVADTGHKPTDWRWIHHLVWEAAGREIPPGHALTFRDGDKRNAALDNLELLSRAELMARNSVHRYPEHIVRAVQALGVLNRQLNRRARAAQPEESNP